MPGPQEFKPCADPHDSCLKYPGEGHRTDPCKICKSFKPRMKRDRASHLKLPLMESARQSASERAPVSVCDVSAAPGHAMAPVPVAATEEETA